MGLVIWDFRADLAGSSMENFDFIIIGAGSAGCVVAERLSRDPGNKVLLLEAGGSDRKLWIKLPIGYGMSFYDASVNWRFNTEPDPGTGGRTSYWPRGKVLGGSSSINAMVYCRGLPGDHDDWRDAGNAGWGWEDVEPAYRAIETQVLENGKMRGEGPLFVSNRFAEYHPIKRYYIAAAAEAGLPWTDDPNGKTPEGACAYQINTWRGMRWSAADAFLRPAMKRPNLTVRTGCEATRIRFEGRWATGVEFRGPGGIETASAGGGIILCAGAVLSPKLLQLSGIGPGALLKRNGIEVIEDNANVGANLQDHVGVNYYFRATQPTLNTALGTWTGRVVAAIQYALRRGGPLSLSVNQMGGLVRSSPDKARPDVQLYFNPLSYTVLETPGKRRLLKPDPFPGFIIGHNPCRPTSTGSIEIAGPDPFAAPKIHPGYLSSQQDIEDVIAAGRLVERLQNSAAMRPLIAGTMQFDLTDKSDAEIVEDFRQRSGSVYHPSCTCRMAPRDRGGVVDASLKVHGVEGLRVVDASAFPNLTSGNTNAPTIMLAHRASQIMVKETGGR
jgi:choline dehydrogenase